MTTTTTDPGAVVVAALAAAPIAGAGPPVSPGAPGGPGWVACDRTGPDDLAAVMGRLGVSRRSGDPRLTGTVLLEHRVWAVAGPVVLALLRERRVPDPSAAAVAVRIDSAGVPVGVAFRGPAAVLAGDPLAEAPGAVVLRDEAALLAWLGERLTDGHLTPLVAALSPLARRSPGALWASVHDGLSGLFAWIGDALGDGPGARQVAGRLLGVRPPLTAAPRYRDLVVGGRVLAVRDRIGCCQSFRAGGEACVDCPRTREEDRIRRML